MAYRFKRDFATAQDGVRSLAVELIDDAVACASRRGRDTNETVHSLRKSCKKLRGLVRLVSPVFDDYRTENAAFRNAGRDFSSLRDGGVLVETYDSLIDAHKDQVDRSRFAPIRRRLTLMQKEMAERADIDDILEHFRETMLQARERACRWHIAADGFEAVGPGLRKFYKLARHAMHAVAKEPTPEAIHEWRKRVKDHWYHARLLSPIWRIPMRAHSEVADRLGDTLGKHHDLEVLAQRLQDDDLAEEAELDVLAGLVRVRQNALLEKAFSTGARLLAERAPSLTHRWQSYWDAWREHEPHQAALAA